MDTIITYASTLFSAFPVIVWVVFIISLFWAATKAFPKFGEKVNAAYDALMGTDEEYDSYYDTGYTNTRRWN